MSKSLKRVRAALEAAGLETSVLETALARTAQDAATAVGCDVDQIAKSIMFLGQNSGSVILFITAGSNQVDAIKASELAGEPLGKADAAVIRAQTGFAIGGVSPIGHLNAPKAFLDPKLLEFDQVWAAAGTPNHVFPISGSDLLKLSDAQTSDFTA
jgi:prolyl-tRNA editing enzyme YbaK/EbsC (Cys-tRNA(Pro) deacylase)